MSAVDRVNDILETVVDAVDTLTNKGLLAEGDIEELEKVAGHAELFLRPQEPDQPGIDQIANAHFNGLTPAQQERLVMLAEECTEVAHCITKILRHGYDSYSPDHPMQGNNRDHLLKEMGELAACIGMISLDIPAMQDEGLCDQRVEVAMRRKLRYSHHQAADFKDYLASVENDEQA
jgi:hypothetical protein